LETFAAELKAAAALSPEEPPSPSEPPAEAAPTEGSVWPGGEPDSQEVKIP